MCSSIAYGGLGVKNVILFNKALLGNGCGALGLKILAHGGESLLQNTEWSGEVGDPSLIGGLMVVGFGRASLWAGKLS